MVVIMLSDIPITAQLLLAEGGGNRGGEESPLSCHRQKYMCLFNIRVRDVLNFKINSYSRQLDKALELA